MGPEGDFWATSHTGETSRWADTASLTCFLPRQKIKIQSAFTATRLPTVMERCLRKSGVSAISKHISFVRMRSSTSGNLYSRAQLKYSVSAFFFVNLE